MAKLGKILLFPLGLLAGAGGGTAVTFLVPAAPVERAPVTAGDARFVTLGALLIPLTIADGQLTAFVTVEPQLEVGEEDQEGVTARLPLIIHAVNVRTYGAPLAAGPDGRLPDVKRIKAIVVEEATKVLGRGVVRSVAITRLASA